ncbi:peptidoglycan-binding domain-containing protein [Aliiroseovarius crassostreae]|uniref:peptidoglycan-binding domain-containing protein n=1 Tax=Aliiroseovarius crassostreae TaxID=154981 RepID=UPI0022084B2A|nr:peptidoglycan-binding domain-containing protein [Aliiroseovarius crassostreae]UWP89475.1 peptidoglycan-binding protein [Aliiroseovarius crassostreae]UWQ02118.1 peptidoglycan-binding protein [Aliiroseovarius crassostreae]
MRLLSFPLPIAFLGLVLTGCTSVAPEATKLPEGAILLAPGERPKGGRIGACYGKDTTPAAIETITESKQVEPAVFAPDGNTIITPPRYETVTRQVITAGGQTYYFEVPCPPSFTPEFIASLQRALQARGFYDGPVTSTLDAPTRAAIRAFQSPQFNSDILTMDTARKLGLVAYASPPIYE